MKQYNDDESDYPDAGLFDNIGDRISFLVNHRNDLAVNSQKFLAEQCQSPAQKLFHPVYEKTKACSR